MWLCATWEEVTSDKTSVVSCSPVTSVCGLVDKVVKNVVEVESTKSSGVESEVQLGG